jgi:hypothetical protein
MPMMKSPYPVNVNTLKGHTITAEPDVAVWIPPEIVREAINAGMRETGEPAAPIEAPAETKDNIESDSFEVALDQVIIRILTRNDESDFKNDGTPNTNRVIAEMDPDVRRPTATEVSDAFMRLQENINLAE